MIRNDQTCQGQTSDKPGQARSKQTKEKGPALEMTRSSTGGSTGGKGVSALGAQMLTGSLAEPVIIGSD